MTHEEAVQTLAAERYLLAEMSELEQQDFEAHYFDCAECAEEVRTGLKMADGVRVAERERPGEVVPFVVPRARKGLSAFLPIAAAASLALVVAYQALVIIPGLRSGQGAQAVTPVVLRSASRGDAPEISIGERSGLLAFALDVNLAPPPAEVVYDLTSRAGVRVASGRVVPPPSGTPLIILIPRGSLTLGRYTIIVRDPARPQSEVSEYPFVVR